MLEIEGIWEGIGKDLELINGMIEKTESILVMKITKIENLVYLVNTHYTFVNGNFDTEETFLIQRDGNSFISEDAGGNGINKFDFLKIDCSEKLLYQYNINGGKIYLNLCGNYILTKKL